MLGWETLLDVGWPLGLFLLGMVQTTRGDMDTDAELVEAVQGGDATAYRGLVEKYQERVYHVIYGVVRNREDAKDLTQETFVKAFRNLGSFRADSRFYTWVYRIAMNLAIDFVRRRKRSPISGHDEEIGTRDETGDISDIHRADGPGRALERKRLYTAIMDAVEELPDDQKQVILLREVEGLSYKEIAEVMEIPEGTVMSRLYYARKKLQAALGDLRGAH